MVLFETPSSAWRLHTNLRTYRWTLLHWSSGSFSSGLLLAHSCTQDIKRYLMTHFNTYFTMIRGRGTGLVCTRCLSTDDIWSLGISSILVNVDGDTTWHKTVYLCMRLWNKECDTPNSYWPISDLFTVHCTNIKQQKTMCHWQSSLQFLSLTAQTVCNQSLCNSYDPMTLTISYTQHYKNLQTAISEIADYYECEHPDSWDRDVTAELKEDAPLKGLYLREYIYVTWPMYISLM